MSTATTKRAQKRSRTPSARAGIALAPEAEATPPAQHPGHEIPPSARLFSVSGLVSSSIEASAEYGEWSGWRKAKTARAVMAADGLTPTGGYPRDTRFFMNITYGADGRSLADMDEITFEDFEAVTIAMNDLRDRAIRDRLVAGPTLQPFKAFPLRAE